MTDNELARAEQLARDIHAVVKGRTATHDHGLVMNLRCVLDHLAQAAPAAPGDADEALIAKLRELQPGFDGCVAGHRLAQEAASAIERLRRERDELKHDLTRTYDSLTGEVNHSAALEGALAPFVASYEETEVIGDRDNDVIWIRVSSGMCGRARQLIKGNAK